MRVGRKPSGGLRIRSFIVALGSCSAIEASGHPGGTPAGHFDSGIYCATCHASTEVSDLEGAGDKAQRELAENKHLPAVLEGIGVYSSLDPVDRARIAGLLAAVDRHSTVQLEVPAEVAAGSTFEVRVDVTGGAGPVVAVGLFDRAHRLYARALAVRGFEIVGSPRVEGGRLREVTTKKPATTGSGAKTLRTFFDIEGIASSADTERWAKARIVFTLKAPATPGDHRIVAAYLYGTEKAVSLTTRTDDSRFPPVPLGGETAASGRVRFSQSRTLHVVAQTPPARAVLSGGD